MLASKPRSLRSTCSQDGHTWSAGAIWLRGIVRQLCGRAFFPYPDLVVWVILRPLATTKVPMTAEAMAANTNPIKEKATHSCGSLGAVPRLKATIT